MRKLKLFSLLAVLLCSATMWADVAVDGKLPGAFSVSADKQVYFSQGNLQYTKSTGKFSFMTNQYDMVETPDQNVGDDYADQDVVSLFGWGTSGWDNTSVDATSVHYQPYATCNTNHGTDNNRYQYGPSNANVVGQEFDFTTAESWSKSDDYKNYDWGVYNSGDLGADWRTLTAQEWKYLFEDRTNASNLRALATVNGVKGVILMPDGWTAGDVSLTITMYSYDTNIINTANWETLEGQGCVFLPAARCRRGNTIDNSIYSGCYWSSTSCSASAAFYVYFEADYLEAPTKSSRWLGYSVRLVSETAPASTPDPTPSTAAVNGKLPGAFSVSADKQVYFSQGNLQARATDGDTWTWDFADNQWDYVGNSIANTKINGNGSVSEDGTVDLFGWSTAATYYGIHKNDYGDFYSGAFVDWGNISDIISSYGEGWKTLTKDEWVYLFNTRTNAEDKYATATVNGVSGLVILPDNWTLPEGCSFTAGTNFYFEENVYDATAWGKMEAAGAVFLPAAGYRSTGQYVNSVGDDGYYWSATIYNESQAYCVYFNGLVFLADSEDDRHFGNSVRLVSETAPASTPDPTPDPTPTVSDAATNIEASMAALIGEGPKNITISRTLYKDGFFNTLCLPFSLNASELAASPLAGCKLYSLSDADYDGEYLNLTIAEETTIVAGEPYLIKWSYGSDITTMTFTDVTVTASTGSTVTKGTGSSQVKFVGTIGRSTLPSDETRENYLFVGTYDHLYYPESGDGTSMKGFRAYFIVGSETSTNIPHQAPARLVIAPKMPTGMDNVQGDNVQSTKVIENGQLYIMYKGTKYNVQGKVVK